MGLISRFAIQNLPSTCAYCGLPFKQNREQDLYAWRSSSGKRCHRRCHHSGRDRCADRFGRINRNQFSMLRRTDWLIDLSAQSGVVILRNQQPDSGQPALEPKLVEARPFGSSLRPKRWHQVLRQW
jgi:hypothetical protein